MQLQARLVHAEPGARVVEVSAHQQGRLLASALGEAASAEAAEDRAIERLSQRLGAALGSEPWPASEPWQAPEALESPPRPKPVTGNRAAPADSSPTSPVTGDPAGPAPSRPAAPVIGSSAAANSPAANSPATIAPTAPGSADEPAPKQVPEALGKRREVVRTAAGSTSWEPAAKSEPAAESGPVSKSDPAAESGPAAASDFSFDQASEKPVAEEPPADPEDWSSELAQLELELKRLGWQREQESSYLERAFGHPSRSRLTTYADLLAYLQALGGLEPGSDPANAAIPLRRRDLLIQCDQLLGQLNWDARQGREYLEQHFNLNSRQLLSDSQLLHFNMLLESEWLNRES